MATVRFSKAQFEAALPQNVTVTPIGLIDGEEAYLMSVTPLASIMIRSSVRFDGLAAETGADSIRCWIVNPETMEPVGSKVQSYVTRVPGWEDRLIGVLRQSWVLAKKVRSCSCGHGVLGIFKVKKDGPNKGRKFNKCWSCGHFEWAEVA